MKFGLEVFYDKYSRPLSLLKWANLMDSFTQNSVRFSALMFVGTKSISKKVCRQKSNMHF